MLEGKQEDDMSKGNGLWIVGYDYLVQFNSTSERVTIKTVVQSKDANLRRPCAQKDSGTVLFDFLN